MVITSEVWQNSKKNPKIVFPRQQMLKVIRYGNRKTENPLPKKESNEICLEKRVPK